VRRWLPLLLFTAGCAHAPGGPVERNAAPPSERAASLLRRKCQSCHAIPNPATHSAAAWAAGLAKMRQRVALADSEWGTLLALVPADSARN
jgi:cytochrome c5